MNLKDIAKKILIALRIDFTLSMKYDRLTEKIIKKCVKPDSVCVDVGCHKGEIMGMFLKQSPKGRHYGFEPIPYLFETIHRKFSPQCKIYDIALSDSVGSTTFNYIRNAPAYSGIKKRDYNIENPDIEILNVKLDMLDNIIPSDERIDFIKIDVEGAELSVLQGAKHTIQRCKPYILFEFGVGASNYYNTSPDDIFTYFAEKSMSISLLSEWIAGKPCLTLEQLKKHYADNSEFYFIAHK